jgi:hypothetical protein
MIGRYAILASRVQQDLLDLERVVERIEQALQIAEQNPAERDLLIDSVALNLHDWYSGLERIFSHIASGVDQSTPEGADWHRELPRQMTIDVPGLRSRVLTTELAAHIDEYLRFRHVVRHTYAFELDQDRVEHLAIGLRPVFEEVKTAILKFAAQLRDMADQA